LGVEIGLDLDVTQALRRCAPEHDVTENPAEAPHVLVFEKRPVTPAIDLDGELILTTANRIGDVELGRRAAVFAVADTTPVHPHVERRVHSAKLQIHPAPGPVLGDRKGGAIGADGIVVARRPRVLTIECKRVSGVDVDRRAEALQLPAAGHADRGPARIVEPWLKEVRGS
jgi:hypothetical protein